jgi:hypothetical protein
VPPYLTAEVKRQGALNDERIAATVASPGMFSMESAALRLAHLAEYCAL